jgi:signal transduction histidine kinase/ActR/RegA family two-component response regulator
VRLRARELELIRLVERRTAEARAAQEAAEQANRAKDHFLAVLGHELRTPLTPVLLSVSTLLEEGIAPEAREHLEMIRRNVELGTRLVDDLLDLARIGRGQFSLEREVVDVHEVLGRALEVCFSEVFAAGLEVVEDFAAEAHHARADSARLMQLFWNLIRNAAKFASPGTALTIRTGNEAAGGGRGPGPGEAGGAGRLLVVEFEDNGIGIEPQMLERIFDPFEQGGAGRRRGEGLGLGLAIARAVAEAHGGRLSASSPGKGRGASFRLELATVAATAIEPAPAAAPSRGGPAAEDPPHRRPAGLRILLVEDNADTLGYLEWALRRHGHGVTAAPTLADARRAAGDGDFDLLISDIELPDGSGLELMRDLRPRGIRGIALSGHGSEDDVRQSSAAGFAAHLVKPVLAGVLDEAIGLAARPAPEEPATVGPGLPTAPGASMPGEAAGALRVDAKDPRRPTGPRTIARPLRDRPRA